MNSDWSSALNSECLPFTEKIRKFRLECKWKDYFGSPDRKISEINGTSSEVLQNSQPEYPNGKLCSIYFFLPVPRPTQGMIQFVLVCLVEWTIVRCWNLKIFLQSLFFLLMDLRRAFVNHGLLKRLCFRFAFLRGNQSL